MTAEESNQEGLSGIGKRLLLVAEEAAKEAAAEMPPAQETPSPLSEFVQTYREWITAERGRMGTQQEQSEQWQLIVHGMLSAGDVEEAIRLLLRYAKIIWGKRGPSELRVEGDNAVLVFNEPFRSGPEGLIAAIWHLALTACELEFLANARFTGMSGRVVHNKLLPDTVLRLLFGRQIHFEEKEVALIFPRHHLRRPIVARGTDLPNFFRELLPLTLGGRRESMRLASLITGLIREDKRGPVYRKSSLIDVASRLGMSSATLRRRLAIEGSSFREIRDSVHNELAQAWLRQHDIAIEEITERLGYSDAFAFRRFFHRHNGCSPSAFRKNVLTSEASG